MFFEEVHLPYISIQFIYGTDQDKHIKFIDNKCFLFEWTNYTVVGTSDNPLNDSDYFYNGKIGRHNTGTLLFKNFVGTVRFRDVTFFVESPKISLNDFNKLIKNIDERINAITTLIFDSEGSAQAKFKKDHERFQNFYIYQKLFNSLKESKIIPYIQYVFKQPNYLLKRDIETTKIELINNLSNESIIDVFSGSTPVAKAKNQNKNLGFLYKGQNIIPLEMNEHTNSISTNTSENQFIKFFIKLCIKILTKFLNDLTSIDTEDSLKNVRLMSEIDFYRNELQNHLRSNFLKNISSLKTINYSSTILTRRYGYKELYREYINLKRTPISCFDDESLIELFQNRSIDKLYEYTCLFRLVDIIQGIYDEDATAHVTFTTDKIYTISLSETNTGVTFSFPAKESLPQAKLLFQHSFTKRNNSSYSVNFEPDFTLQIFHDDIIYNYHFDAKFRVSNDSTSKNEDLVKMHGYRDGIKNTIGAFVLFPGDHPETHQISDKLPYECIGAFPLNFNSDNDEFLKHALSQVLTFYAN